MIVYQIVELYGSIMIFSYGRIGWKLSIFRWISMIIIILCMEDDIDM